MIFFTIEIANRIVSGETMIAEQHDDVSIIFADIVSFTETALLLKPAEVVGTLNELFTEFDVIGNRTRHRKNQDSR